MLYRHLEKCYKRLLHPPSEPDLYPKSCSGRFSELWQLEPEIFHVVPQFT